MKYVFGTLSLMFGLLTAASIYYGSNNTFVYLLVCSNFAVLAKLHAIIDRE